MKHTLKLGTVDYNRVTFHSRHQLAPSGNPRVIGSEPYGPFSCAITTDMYRQDWDAAGQPLEIEVEL